MRESEGDNIYYDCLMVDDEASIASSASEYFNLFGVRTAYVCSYEECLSFLEKNEIGVLLLDINLGTKSGFQLCKQLRENSAIPILFLSARTSDDDILAALNLGGDDYIKKPFTLSVLLAKVKAVLRRCKDAGREVKRYRVLDIVVEPSSHKVFRSGSLVKLKEMEYRLLLYLIEHKNCVVSKQELLEKVWQDSFVGEGTLSVHVRHLREKLEEKPNAPELIKTVWGTGYLLEDPS